MFVFEFVFSGTDGSHKFMREIAVSDLPKCAIIIFYGRHLYLNIECSGSKASMKHEAEASCMGVVG